MALDTTIGGAASDSYVTLAEYEAYVAAQGLRPLGGSDARHEQELRRAASVLDSSYNFRGIKNNSEQAREWPRFESMPRWQSGMGIFFEPYPIRPDEIPGAIKRAQMEMAWLIHNGADPFATYEGAVKRKREKVDVIEEETEWTGGQGRPMFTGVDRILRDYITSGGGQVKAVRG